MCSGIEEHTLKLLLILCDKRTVKGFKIRKIEGLSQEFVQVLRRRLVRVILDLLVVARN